MKMEDGCFCGAVRYTVTAAPRRVTHCHCIHCRRTSGAPFVTWSEVDAEHFRFTAGEPRSFEARPKVTRTFCGACGTPITYQHADDPGAMDVTTASFDEPERAKPEDHVWYDRCLPWIRLADDLPRYGTKR